jgi:opacity protein-like surface antigen
VGVKGSRRGAALVRPAAGAPAEPGFIRDPQGRRKVLRRRAALLVICALLISTTAGVQGQAISRSLDGFASFGGSVGFMKWLFDVDVAEQARVRPILQGVFRYRFNRDWVLVGESGFGWNDYPEPKNAVTVVFPTTFGLLRRITDLGGVAWYGSFGAGIYFWDHKQRGKTFRDPWTDNFQKGFEPGFYLGVEGEYQFARQMTVTLTFQNHYMFSTHKDELPAAFGDDDDFLSLRLGVHFHWSPERGIIWGTSQPPESQAPAP